MRTHKLPLGSIGILVGGSLGALALAFLLGRLTIKTSFILSIMVGFFLFQFSPFLLDRILAVGGQSIF